MQRKKHKGILAEGEVTGHYHRLTSGVDVFETEEGTREFETEKEDCLTHEEHGPITISPGRYESDQVREWDSFEEEARRVID